MGDDGRDKRATDLLAFPARVHVKAIGAHESELLARVRSIVARHVDASAILETSTRPSRGGKYVAVTVSIEAQTRAQVDAIYQELSTCKEVLIAL